MGSPKKLAPRTRAAAGRRSVTTPDLDVGAELQAPAAAVAAPGASGRRAPGQEGRLRRLIDIAESRSVDPVERIAAVRSARDELEKLELAAWRAGRKSGLSWLDMAKPIGITRSAAQQRLAALESRRGGR